MTKVYINIETRTLDKPIYTNNFEIVKYSSVIEYPCYYIEIKDNKLGVNHFLSKDNITTIDIYLQNINYFTNQWTLMSNRQHLKELIICCSLFRPYSKFTIFANDDLIKSIFIDDHLYDIRNVGEYDQSGDNNCLVFTRISLNKFNMVFHHMHHIVNFQIPYDGFLKIMQKFQNKNGDIYALKKLLRYTNVGIDNLKTLSAININHLYIILRLVASRVSNPQKQIINLNN